MLLGRIIVYLPPGILGLLVAGHQESRDEIRLLVLLYEIGEPLVVLKLLKRQMQFFQHNPMENKSFFINVANFRQEQIIYIEECSK